MTDQKPLNWTPAAGIGYTVVRRPDGGMTLTFTNLSDATIQHWHDFALEHLLGSDRLTRNLYDLRQVGEIPEKAVRTAMDANSDPGARNIRLAVVVANQKVAEAIREIYYSVTAETSAAIKIFTDMDAAETWLSRPLDQIA
ncbi:MAG: hypothetical protein HY781_13185 [Chloroflexi bacterium]|nr:hypothetical protein [Chloroflexota bacterium]